MTIRPRHYARLLVEGASAAVLAQRIDAVTALAAVRQQLAELMILPSTHDTVAKLLTDAGIDELTRSIVTELAITGHLSWLAAIGRSIEQSARVDGQPGIARVRVARPDVVADVDLQRSLEPLLGPIGALKTTIAPDQLGGITIQVADQRLAAGLDQRLAQLRQTLRDASRAQPRERISA